MTATDTSRRPFAVITGASSGIGRELALECARHGYDLLIAADRPQDATAAQCRMQGVEVQVLQADLATSTGVGHMPHCMSVTRQAAVGYSIRSAGGEIHVM